MPKFLTQVECYRLLQRELPEGVYADGDPQKFYTTADMWAVADVAASGYANLERIYDNYWPQTADERLPDWEVSVFDQRLSAALSLNDRRGRVMAKIRSRKGIRREDMIAVVKEVIGADKLVDISTWGGSTGSWMIGESELGIETIFGGYVPGSELVYGPDLCSAKPEDFGLTDGEWQMLRELAYTYQVNIYGYTPTPSELAQIDEALSRAEPARSGHVIVSGLDPNDMLDGDT